MNIGIIGTGNVGGTLGRRWALLGHKVQFGTRSTHSEKVIKLLKDSGKNAKAVSVDEAIQNNHVIALTVPWTAASKIVKSVKNWKGKILIDCTNPLKVDYSGLSVGHTTSAGEKIAKLAIRAKVVKAFNSVGSMVMNNPRFGKDRAVLLIAGEDRSAKRTVKRLAEDLGFEVLDAGGIVAARYLEYFAMLWIHTGFHANIGPDFGFKLLKR